MKLGSGYWSLSGIKGCPHIGKEQFGVQEPEWGEEGTIQEGSGGKRHSVGSGAQADGQGCLCRAGPGTGSRDSQCDGTSH